MIVEVFPPTVVDNADRLVAVDVIVPSALVTLVPKLLTAVAFAPMFVFADVTEDCSAVMLVD